MCPGASARGTFLCMKGETDSPNPGYFLYGAAVFRGLRMAGSDVFNKKTTAWLQAAVNRSEKIIPRRERPRFPL